MAVKIKNDHVSRKQKIAGLISTHQARSSPKSRITSPVFPLLRQSLIFAANKYMNSKKLVNILLHVLSSALIIVVPIFLLPLKHSEQPDFINWPRIVFTAMQTLAFYFTAFVLYPRLLVRKRALFYVLSVIFTCIFIALIFGIMEYWLLPESKPYVILANVVVKIFIGLFVLGAATSYRFIADVIRSQREQEESLKMELSFLRSQVSPHFMFNALNSMVALARKKSDQLEPALMRMSSLMHYMLYDSDEDKVSLNREVEYIKSYIDLQTLRFGDSVKILFMVNPGNHSHAIEPMLLIPLVENAFKHGVHVAEEPEIDIQLVAKEDEISLNVSNKTPDTSLRSADKTKGIGLTNLKKRLNILYPGKHELSASNMDNWYHASLKIFTNAAVPGSR
jgi:two-component system LytT family sensor kinase